MKKKENADTLLLLATAKETQNTLRKRQLHLDSRYEGLNAWLAENAKTADKETVAVRVGELILIGDAYKELHKEYHKFAEWVMTNLPEKFRPTLPPHDCDLN